jgi:hypothetical protein
MKVVLSRFSFIACCRSHSKVSAQFHSQCSGLCLGSLKIRSLYEIRNFLTMLYLRLRYWVTLNVETEGSSEMSVSIALHGSILQKREIFLCKLVCQNQLLDYSPRKSTQSRLHAIFQRRILAVSYYPHLWH